MATSRMLVAVIICISLIIMYCEQPDTTPPEIVITYPVSGNTVSGTVAVTIEVTDDSEVLEVQLFLDGQQTSIDYDSPWAFSWNTDEMADGEQHTIYAKGTDEHENVGTSDIVTVTIPAPPSPILHITPNLLAFGDSTNSLTLSISNGGDGSLSWDLSDDKSWIALAPTSGTTTTEIDQVNVTLNRLELEPGDYSGLISITSNGGSESATVTMSIPNNPVLSLSSVADLDFGNSQNEQSLSISNTGTGLLIWNIIADQEWLEVSPINGETSADTDQITISVDRSGLELGDYLGTIEITSNGGADTLIVQMTVAETPILSISPSVLAFGSDQSEKAVYITNIGTGTLTWNISYDIGWISIGSNSGTTTADETDSVLVYINRTGLDPGDYSGTVTVETLNGMEEEISVTMTVALMPILSVTPLELNFGGLTEQMTFSITNTGTGTLSWNTTASETWISAFPQEGTTTNETDEVYVNVERSWLSPGEYSGTVTIQSDGGDAIINVIETVNPPPVIELIDLVINDDQSGSSMGNGDGTAQAGEIIELGLILQNNGPGDISNLNTTFELASGDADDITVINSYISSGSIDEYSTDEIQYFVLQINELPGGEDIDFDLTFQIFYGSNQIGGQGISGLELVVSELPPLNDIEAEQDNDIILSDIYALRPWESHHLFVGTFGDQVETFRSLVRFPTINLPANARILSAKLYLYIVDLEGGSLNLQIKGIGESWNEDEITWDNQPGYFDSGDGSYILSSSTWQYFDVTNTVEAAVEENWEYGFALKAQNESIAGKWVVLNSSDSSNIPFLKVWYTYIPL
ncbi:MAG: DNRLRE domain-containing protein [Candidatus Marinimicrobia bacterium]|nr:DNRLRE domain-containing protein [Candidatus Brocadiales bacterium]MBL7047682.1 DNRLRE domain-containing protein [Candidatus Neomarinimicrobiota bacterium]